uniref:Hexapeptide transferase n=1 Tax=Ignavibacterium album TaxID=591197 RepID=A0A832DIU0_9BACT
MLKRILYLGYYLKQLEKDKYVLFLNYAANKSKKSKLRLILDSFYSVFRYNISLLEYFQFRFFEKDHNERLKWAGTGFMYEYQLKMNPKDKRDILDDKRKFYKYYGKFIKHLSADVQNLKDDDYLVKRILSNPSGKIVFKVYDGKCGRKILIKSVNDFDEESLIHFMINNEYDLVEEYIIQHPELLNLSPSAVNTIRIFTQLNKQNKVEILGCRLRISINKSVDNMAAGNIAAPINEKTGIVIGPGVYSDITKPQEKIHPVTQKPIEGFKVPFWKETLQLATDAALLFKQNRSIGWDIAITEYGPDLIEGNHDWCKLLWQLPVNKGMKDVLIKYLSD